jgi:sulfide:quinone oxidoreductase
MPSGDPYRVLIAGAGVAGLECMLALRALAEERVEIDVLSPESEFAYRPVSVAQPFGAGEVHRFPLAELLSPAGATHRQDALTAVRADDRQVTTAAGDVLDYDALVVACGGRTGEKLPGALVFRGAADSHAVQGLVDDLAAGRAGRVVFAVPSGRVWALPLYELALLTASHLARIGRTDAELTLLTPEHAPLAVFGPAACRAIGDLLASRGIAVVSGIHPVAFEGRELRGTSGVRLPADRVVSLPRLAGPSIPGLPSDAEGFVVTTDQGSVQGLHGVYAAGDAVSFPINQGGIAAQQADAVAERVAARAGARVTPRPFRPVLRGLLLTGGVPRYLRSDAAGGRGDTSEVATEPLWWPPTKVAGRYLAPFLADLAGHELPGTPAVPGAVEVHREVPGSENPGAAA